jgi:integrase
VLRRALNHALARGQVQRNVATLIEPPRRAQPEVRPLTPEQAAAFLSAARGDRLEARFGVALAHGLRQGELLGLRWDDLDLAAETRRVERQLQRIDGAFRLVGLKTRQSRRTIAIPATLVAQLCEHRVRQEAERAAAGAQWVESGLVFPSTIGTPLDPRNLTRRYKALLARTGLPDLRFHDLRHTCASLLLARGVPARAVMATQGRSHLSLTLNVYAHLFPGDQRQAADAMEGLLTAAEEPPE